ncbi:MAG TPA: RNA-directed DNA polymerase [Actinomycetota bacterium]|nr:RNA-directed DNA polymerase [Actinomycetota bacterium]
MLERSTQPVRLVPERKPGGVRWLAHLDPVAAATYAAAVIPIVPEIEAALSPTVVANRVAEVRSRPPSIRLEAWASARVRFRALVAELAEQAGAAVVADVRDFYGSVVPSVLAEALSGLGCGLGDVKRAVEAVRLLSTYGVRGLPIGPEPSAVLGNAVLSGLDASLASAGFRHVRWVDDVLVFAPDAAGARDALRVLTGALARLRLRPATEKTRVLADPRTLAEDPTPFVSGPEPRTERASG